MDPEEFRNLQIRFPGVVAHPRTTSRDIVFLPFQDVLDGRVHPPNNNEEVFIVPPTVPPFRSLYVQCSRPSAVSISTRVRVNRDAVQFSVHLGFGLSNIAYKQPPLSLDKTVGHYRLLGRSSVDGIINETVMSMAAEKDHVSCSLTGIYPSDNEIVEVLAARKFTPDLTLQWREGEQERSAAMHLLVRVAVEKLQDSFSVVRAETSATFSSKICEREETFVEKEKPLGKSFGAYTQENHVHFHSDTIKTFTMLKLHHTHPKVTSEKYYRDSQTFAI